MYVPSETLLVAAESFLESALKNEDKVPHWLIAALKTSNNPIVIDGVIVTTNFHDLYGEDDEFHPAPSFDRENYRHVLKKDTKTKSIMTTDKMVASFIDSRRSFRYDVEFHVVLFDDGRIIRSIDVLDVEVYSSDLTFEADDLLTDWFYARLGDIEGHVSRRATGRGHLRVVVDNS